MVSGLVRSVVETRVLYLFERLPPLGVTGLLPIQLSLRRVVLLIRVVVGRLLLQVTSPITFDELLKATKDKVTVISTLGSEVTVLVKLSRLKPSHQTFSNLRVVAA
jgi:hypothetical protein